MKNIKKLLLIGAMSLLTFTVSADIFSTNLYWGTSTNVLLLLTNRAAVYAVELTGTNAANTIQLYDCDTLGYVTNGPAFGTSIVSAAYTYRSGYPTNYVTGPYVVGYGTNYAAIPVGSYNQTNYITNAGFWTLTATNAAATNKANPLLALTVGANAYAIYNVDALFSRGIVAMGFGTNAINANGVGLTIYYRSGQ